MVSPSTWVEELALISPLTHGIDLVEVFRVVDVNLVGSDSHNGSIFFMHTLDLEGKLAPMALGHQVVVSLIPIGSGRELGPWEFGKWAQIQPLHENDKNVDHDEESDGYKESDSEEEYTSSEYDSRRRSTQQRTK